jgi:phage antirepressor YoqD-like protein
MLNLKLNLNKIKTLSIGVAIGLSITTLTPVFATVQQYILTKINYPIMVNGEEYTNDELPILGMNGSTYVPLRAVGNMLDAKVNWNEELKRVEIEQIESPIITTPTINPKDYIFSKEMIDDTPKYVFYNEKNYTTFKEASNVLYNHGYQYRMNTEKNNERIFYILNNNNEVVYIFQKDDSIIVDGRAYFDNDVIESLIN